MSNCTDCNNGCVETTSDQCVKYTGDAIPFLGIATGVPLSEVERRITDYLLTVLNGSGIVPEFDTDEMCDVVEANLPEGAVTLNNILTALLATICELKVEIEDIKTQLAAL